MNHTPAQILQAYLVSNDVDLFKKPKSQVRWPLYANSLPDGVNVEDDAGAVYDTVGTKDGRDMDSGESYWHHGIQVRVRSKVFTAGLLKAKEVVDEFATVALAEIKLDQTTYEIGAITQTSDVLPLAGGEAEALRRRSEFTVNFLVTVKEAS